MNNLVSNTKLGFSENSGMYIVYIYMTYIFLYDWVGESRIILFNFVLTKQASGESYCKIDLSFVPTGAFKDTNSNFMHC